MVSLGTITYKNQLTIPKEIMELSQMQGIRKVLIEPKSNGILIKPVNASVVKLAGFLHNSNRKPVSIKREHEITQRKIANQIAAEGL